MLRCSGSVLNYDAQQEEFIDNENDVRFLDRKNKTLVLHIKSKKPVSHFWLYCTQKGVRYSENDCNRLPSKKEIILHYESLPKRKELKYVGLSVGE